ncbi:MAG TPA: Ppx/GppA phosphatase family protein [Polyangiaceae bacterium]|jgi:exopolyphosphatase/guanosine-5'-triphosphate,3'-diphosphate pyrophosphatase
MRVATIDIGTNTVLLLVAERSENGGLHAVEERATITRLGEGVDRTKVLAPAAIERTLACLDEYAGVVRAASADRVAVVGTSAMRDAGGSETVGAHVRAAFGVDARVVSGDEEARLTFRGALSGLPFERREVAVFDIGGGSTEVVIGSPGGTPSLSFAKSFDIGSVRLTERHVRHDPPTTEERDAITHAARKVFELVPPRPGLEVPVGIAGTVTTLAAVSLGLVPYDGARIHGHVLSRADLQAAVDRLAALDLAARRDVAGMEPKRADVIVAGGLIALALVDHWGADALRVSDRGVRWGLAEELSA